MTGAGARIVGLGRYAPAQVVDNAAIEARLGLAPGWIARRTGVQSRRYAGADEAVTDIAVKAAQAALRSSAMEAGEVGLTLLATSTPDHLLPPSAPLLAHRLGLDRCGAIDLAGACSGFIYALAFAEGFVRSQGRAALVVAANVLSRRLNPVDPASLALFADAAGAVVLAPSEDPNAGILGLDLASDGARYDLMGIRSGGSRRPFSPDTAPADGFIAFSDGAAIFAHAVRIMCDCSRRALDRAGLSALDISRWAPHQANARITEAVRRKLCIDESRVLSSLAMFGNSSAATIPFALAESAEARPFRPGERVLMSAVGAGMIGGALVYGF